jgi:hypothetical protein
MLEFRKIIAVAILCLLPIALTGISNEIFDTPYDFAELLYDAGFATFACMFLVHQFVVRRLISRDHMVTQLLGVAVSGLASIVLYDLASNVAARICYTQRVSGEWDEGMSEGLPRAAAFGVGLTDFSDHLPSTLFAALVYSVVWFPGLVLLERWAYSLKRKAQEAEQFVAPNRSLPLNLKSTSSVRGSEDFKR